MSVYTAVTSLKYPRYMVYNYDRNVLSRNMGTPDGRTTLSHTTFVSDGRPTWLRHMVAQLFQLPISSHFPVPRPPIIAPTFSFPSLHYLLGSTQFSHYSPHPSFLFRLGFVRVSAVLRPCFVSCASQIASVPNRAISLVLLRLVRVRETLWLLVRVLQPSVPRAAGVLACFLLLSFVLSMDPSSGGSKPPPSGLPSSTYHLSNPIEW